MSKLQKVLLTVFLCVSVTGSLWALDKKYGEGYELVSSAINTSDKESFLSLYKNQLVFLKQDPKKKKKMIVFGASIRENGELNKPKELKDLTKLGIDGTFAFDEKQNKIYFSKFNPIVKNFDLYETVLEKGKWSEPKRMKIDGTGGDRNEEPFLVVAGWNHRELGLSGFKNPSLANNGKRIYFTATFKGGAGSTDIWYIDMKDDGKSWKAPVNCGENVNSSGREDFAFSVGDTLLVFTTTTGSIGANDLFVSKINKDGTFGKSKNLGRTFNSEVNDMNLVATTDNAYLISNRNPRTRDDIFHFKKLPQKVAPPPPPPPVPESELIVQKMLTWNYTLFYFDFDVRVLNAEFVAQFKELVSEMKQFPKNTVFEVAGHTDGRGSEAYNMKLSIDRAEFVKNLLIKEGFPAEQIVTKGFGKSQLIIENAKTEEEHMQNRRCGIRIINQ